MARLARLAIAGLPHLIIHCALAGQAAFVDDADRQAWRDALADAARQAGVALHGYGLHGQELRLLATPAAAPALGAMMQAVGRRYVRAFNLRHARSGSPWDGRFRCTVLDPASLFLAALRYCEVGDVDEGLAAARGESWRWSSAAHHLGQRSDPLITEHAAYWTLGNTPFEREAAYRDLLERPPEPGLAAAIRDAALRGWALGPPAFIASLGGLAPRRVQRLRRGRPAKANPGVGQANDTSLIK